MSRKGAETPRGHIRRFLGVFASLREIPVDRAQDWIRLAPPDGRRLTAMPSMQPHVRPGMPKSPFWVALALALVLALLVGVDAADCALAPEPTMLTLDTLEVVPSYPDAYRAGRKEAMADLSAGAARWLTYGNASSARWDFADLLDARFGLELVPISVCDVSDAIVGRAAGYDDVVRRRLEGRYGPGVIERAWADALAVDRLREEAIDRASSFDEDEPRPSAVRSGRSLPDPTERRAW